MAKRKDPAVAVIRYFETAGLEQAKLVLSLVKDAVLRRSGPLTKVPRAPRAARVAEQPAPAAGNGGVAQAAQEQPAVARPRPPRRPAGDPPTQASGLQQAPPPGAAPPALPGA